MCLCRGGQTLFALACENPAMMGKILLHTILCIICRNLHQIHTWQNRWCHGRNRQDVFKFSFGRHFSTQPPSPDSQTSSSWCLVCQVLVSSASRAVITTTNLDYHLQQHSGAYFPWHFCLLSFQVSGKKTQDGRQNIICGFKHHIALRV